MEKGDGCLTLQSSPGPTLLGVMRSPLHSYPEALSRPRGGASSARRMESQTTDPPGPRRALVASVHKGSRQAKR